MGFKIERHALVGLFMAGLCLAACEPGLPSANGGVTAPNAGSNVGVGSVSFKLTVGGGANSFTFNQVTYDLSGNGFHRTAAVDVSNSVSFATVISGIPFGTGYLLILSAQDVAHSLMPCQGSSTFDVTTATTVPVAVDLTCHQAVTNTNPPPVPVPRPAVYAFGALLLVLGATRVRRSSRA
ncbi:MAG TPA: hypothetical protein VH560_04365 [Polyangia bacterium]|jgi:hypothetical protein|nr:hypothetical protein [Polyangia bacterium]